MSNDFDSLDPNSNDTISSRSSAICKVIDAFLLERSKNPQLSSDSLLEAHADLMPELGEMLSRLARIDAARTDANDHATCETTAYTGELPENFGLRVRCPHCFHQINLEADEPLHKIRCPACGSSFSLVDSDEDDADKTRGIGSFEFVKRLGAGSFGTVWEARDADLHRHVAVKVPRKGKLEPREMEQFIREARVTAQLNHPGIVRVYEVGRDGDTVYIVSDLVDGVPLTDRIEAGGVDPQEAAELVARIADALEHAHVVGVVHRDLKPANIMMDQQGAPYVTDFGLAKRHAGDVTITADGHILGTPAYMSPEQASGKPELTDRRSDVYSLGVILFELLTGERPFRGDISRLIKKVIHDEPPRPRDMRRSVPRDLETICLKCLEKDPDRRYSSAAELRDDLRRWTADEPIMARPIGRIEKARRWCRKNPVLAAVVATAVLTLILTTEAGIGIANARRAGLDVAMRELNNYRQRNSAELQELRTIVHDAAVQVVSTDLDPHDSDQLTKLVASLYKDHDQATQSGLHPFATWYILDDKGTMLAITPKHHQIAGQDFHSRDYFRGAIQRQDFEVYTSAPYRSANDDLVKFSIATPITIDDERYVIGASVATDSTRAIQREENLMREMVRWTTVALIPSATLVSWLLATYAIRLFRRKLSASNPDSPDRFSSQI